MAAPIAALDPEEDLERRYKTILFSVFIIGCTWILFLRASPPKPADGIDAAAHNQMIWIISGLLVLLGLATVAGSGLLSFGLFDWNPSITVKRKCLPGVTVAFMVILGAMMSISGGAVNSAFSHYLSATSAVALILAVKPSNKLIILVATCAVYWTASVYVLSTGVTASTFNGWCFVISIWLAALAGWKNRVRSLEHR